MLVYEQATVLTENLITEKKEGRRMNDNKGIKGFRTKYLMMIAIAVVIIFVATLSVKVVLSISREDAPEIITKSTLEKIVHISDLSTFEAVYNGIAKVMNEKKPDKVDYYVSYEAKVKAGFDVERVELEVDDAKKVISVTIPEIKITGIDVDIASLDYIFMNDKANESTVSEQAYKKCIEDVENESSSENAICTLAGKNAKDVITALINPFIEQLDDDYELTVKIEGADNNEKNN